MDVRMAAAHASLAAYPSEPGYLTINKGFAGLKALHSEPWIFEVADFLSKREATELLALCEERMQVAVDSQGARREGWEFTNLRFDPRLVVGWLEPRVRELTGLDFDCVTDGTALHYWPGSGGIPAHHDHNHETFYHEAGRVLTVFIYLSDVAGATGGTSFTELGLVAQPAFGMPGALNGFTDPRLAHAGLPTQDEKWLLRFFFHAKPLFPPSNPFHHFDDAGYALRQTGQYDHECGRGAFASF